MNWISLFLLCFLCASSYAQPDCTLVTTATGIAQCTSLQKLYTKTNGAAWTTNTNWQATTNFCTYFGITCDAAGNVMNIMLPTNNLVAGAATFGIETVDFSVFPSLQQVDFSNNQINGFLPPSIFTATILKIDFNHNQLIGPLPTALGSASALFYLDLSFNQLSGVIPSLSKTPPYSLSTLKLNNNNFLSTYPTWISYLPLITPAACDITGNPLLTGCKAFDAQRCTCVLASVSTSKSPSITPKVTKTVSPTYTPTKSGTASGITQSASMPPTMSKTPPPPKPSKSAKATISNSKSVKPTKSITKSHETHSVTKTGSLTPKSTPVCGNGIVESGEECDPNTIKKLWWQSCCRPTCRFRKAGRFCQSLAVADCKERGKCNYKGICMKGLEIAANGTKCIDRKTGQVGYCNFGGTCLGYPSASPSPKKK